MTAKITETASHIYFLTGPFSQWHKSKFVQQLEVGGSQMVFNCCEQYQMASKAKLFGDSETLELIMATQPEEGVAWREVPKLQKALGRQVKNFNEEVWAANAKQIVFRANWSKFTQNEDLKTILLSNDKYLVEGAHYDRIWGVGLAWNDPKILDEENWRGSNWLGEVLMQVRHNIRIADIAKSSNPTAVFNEWAYVMA